MKNEPETFRESKAETRPKPRKIHKKLEVNRGEIGERLKKESNIFTKEFNKYFKTFVTGAFTFVAAFLWRDAISSTLNEEGVKVFFSSAIPSLGQGGIMYLTAVSVTIVAVISIIFVNRVLKS
jgi:hypothetical protein